MSNTHRRAARAPQPKAPDESDFDRPADFFMLFPAPVGDKALAIGGWDYGSHYSAPEIIEARLMRGTAEALQRRGYTAFANSHEDFESYIAVRKGVNVERVREVVKGFMFDLADGLVNDMKEKFQ